MKDISIWIAGSSIVLGVAHTVLFYIAFDMGFEDTLTLLAAFLGSTILFFVLACCLYSTYLRIRTGKWN